MGALHRRPVVDGEQRVVTSDLAQQHPGLRGEDGGLVGADVAVGVGHRDAVAGGAVQTGHRGTGRPVVQRRERGARRPVHDLRRFPLPQAQRQLPAADDAAVVVVGLGVDDPQDLQDGVGEVGVPAAGAEADLAEDLAVPEGLEGRRVAEVAVEGLVVELLDEPGPDLADARNIALADRPVHVGEVRALLQAGVPGVHDLVVDLGEVIDRPGVVRFALEVDHGRRGVRRQRVGERRGRQAHQVDVVLERRRGRREAHRAHLGGQARGVGRSALEADGAQPAAYLVGLVDDGLEAHLHQLVGGDDAGEAAADDRDLLAVLDRGDLAEARRVGEEVVIGVREVRAEHGDRRLDIRVVGGGGHRGRHRGRTPCRQGTAGRAARTGRAACGGSEGGSGGSVHVSGP